MCTSSVSNVIYHKFSNGAAFYTLNGKNDYVMLEFPIFFQVCFRPGSVQTCFEKHMFFFDVTTVLYL